MIEKQNFSCVREQCFGLFSSTFDIRRFNILQVCTFDLVQISFLILLKGNLRLLQQLLFKAETK